MAYERERDKQGPVGGPLEFEAPVEGEGIDEEQHRKGGSAHAGERESTYYCRSCGCAVEPQLTTCPACCATPNEFVVRESGEPPEDSCTGCA